ncbi:hypothetical protein GGI20_002194 [Coemansia sp. BCRC 34301]|nr:hypothetical protein GGI20_002194 [Coemansia sp. BCRC 34301]
MASSGRRHSHVPTSGSGQSRSQQHQRTGGRETSWLRNNWTESETREVMEILVSEFLANEYCTGAYSKSHAPDARFANLSFSRPPRELYNKVQNLRQRFFTPHCYLLRWAHPKTDARSLKRAIKCLMNPKTRASIHGIFAVDAPEPSSPPFHTLDSQHRQQHQAGLVPASASLPVDNNIAVKSVNYYCDIFRRQDPNLWLTSVKAYQKFLSDRELQSADIQDNDSPTGTCSPRALACAESSSRPKRRRQSTNSRINNNGDSFDDCAHGQMFAGHCIGDVDHHQALAGFGSLPSSLPSSAMFETPSSSSLLTDFGSDFNSDDGSCDHVLLSVAGHSWHKFLSQRNRWGSLGLSYSDKDDWVRQEIGFLVEHFFTLIDSGHPHSTGPDTEVLLIVVPMFCGSFDAPNIEMAISRSRTTRTVRLSRLVDDLISCFEYVDNKEPFTVVSLCRLTDRQTRSTTSLALLVSHGSNSQRFGVFPHNDPMLGRLIAGNENLWHEYTTQGSLMSMAPKEEPQAAFAYAQSGIKYTFFVRLKGHFFEMTRDEDWVPTMVPTQPRATWAATRLSKDALLSIIRHDTEKVLTGMVELYGLRLFCYGFFEAIALPTASSSSAGAARSPSRRISDDPSLMGFGYNSRRSQPQYPPSRGRRSRVSASAIGASTLSGNNSPHSGSNNSPYRRPPGHSSSLTSINQQQQPTQAQSSSVPPLSGRAANLLGGHGSSTNHQSEALHAAMPFLSPQARHYNSFSSVDMAAMSVSLPNSPFFGFPLDGQQFAQGGSGVAHESLFPSLSDAAFASTSTPAAAAAAAAASAAAAAAARASSLLPQTDSSLVGLTSIAGAGGMSDDALAINMYPATSVQSHHTMDVTPPMGHQCGGLDASSLFSNVVTGGSNGVLSNSPAFWDMSSHANLSHHSHGHHLHASMTPIADIQSPAMQMGFRSPHSMVGLTGSMTEMSVAAAAVVAEAAMQFGGVSGEPSSIALYPPQATPAMLGWDDMAAQLNRAHHHNHSSDMLMQLAQPSPTLSHYNLSAQATPAFEAYSTPVLNHLQHAAVPSPYIPSLSASGSGVMQADSSFLMHTPVSSSMANPGMEAEGGPSAMAAYFGVAPQRTANSAGSLETLVSSAGAASVNGQLDMDKAYMYSALSGSTPARQMDMEFPATSC